VRKDERGCCHLLHTESKKHEGPVALRDTYTQIGPTGRPVVIARDAQLHHLKSLLQVSEQSWETPPHSFKLQLGHLLKQAPWGPGTCPPGTLEAPGGSDRQTTT
jgi:hypothetical protein